MFKKEEKKEVICRNLFLEEAKYMQERNKNYKVIIDDLNLGKYMVIVEKGKEILE